MLIGSWELSPLVVTTVQWKPSSVLIGQWGLPEIRLFVSGSRHATIALSFDLVSLSSLVNQWLVECCPLFWMGWDGTGWSGTGREGREVLKFLSLEGKADGGNSGYWVLEAEM